MEERDGCLYTPCRVVGLDPGRWGSGHHQSHPQARVDQVGLDKEQVSRDHSGCKTPGPSLIFPDIRQTSWIIV